MEWNDIKPIRVYGRNFLGRYGKSLGFIPQRILEPAVMTLDRILRFLPTLRSDIHVIGRKRT
jgi:hypothetical protein